MPEDRDNTNPLAGEFSELIPGFIALHELKAGMEQAGFTNDEACKIIGTMLANRGRR